MLELMKNGNLEALKKLKNSVVKSFILIGIGLVHLISTLKYILNGISSWGEWIVVLVCLSFLFIGTFLFLKSNFKFNKELIKFTAE